MKLLKKGQVGGLQGFVLSIVTVAIVLAIGLIVVTELKDAAKVMGTTSALNESVASGSSLTQGGELFIGASACRNASSIPLDLNLYCNVSSTGGVTVAAPNASGNVLIDYTHYTPSAAYNSTGTIITKLATVPTWIGIIIIVSLAFIVLSFFIGRRQ
jgi:hypothetical protein